ncbi:MAG: M67 family metallopeptidase [Prochlorococcaceae cyanobacterium]
MLAVARPQEGCALLLGRGDSCHWLVERIWPCRNVWEPEAERARRFAIDPREQLLAQKWVRSRGLRVLGSAHSHPGAPPHPSATDLLWAFPPALLTITGPSGELRCWWLPQEGAQPLPLAWTMVD